MSSGSYNSKIKKSPNTNVKASTNIDVNLNENKQNSEEIINKVNNDSPPVKVQKRTRQRPKPV